MHTADADATQLRRVGVGGVYLALGRNLRSFEIQFEFESAVRFDSVRKWLANSKIFESNRPCLLLAGRKLSQIVVKRFNQTVNQAD